MRRIDRLGLLALAVLFGLSAFNSANGSLLASPIQFQSTPYGSVEDCQRLAAQIIVGMTRAQISMRMEQDGGIGALYKSERAYYFTENGRALSFLPVDGKYSVLCKLRFDFRPHGMPDEYFDDPVQFEKWTTKHILPCVEKTQPSRASNVWGRIIHPFRGATPPECRKVVLSGEPTDEVFRIRG
ncbi:MAG TPA: hypothetical protein VFO86_02050, partial [Terriglobia bacterium]|nr:hypothetical protein [Terriglobia bacterium]